MSGSLSNFLTGGAAIILWLLLFCGYGLGMGVAVKGLALKKGYNVSFAWGFFLGVLALLYWGLAPVHPELQAQIIAEGMRCAQDPPQ